MRIHESKTMRALVALVAILLLEPRAGAHEDDSAPLVKVEKVYAAPKPIGYLRVVYTCSEVGKPQILLVECDLFRRTVPVDGLTDLPRPDWDRFGAAYSATSFEDGKWTDRPYLYLIVPLNGPRGENWEQTWATFHFNAEGKLTRKIKRFIPLPSPPDAVDMVWEDWEIGSGQSAQSVIEATRANRK